VINYDLAYLILAENNLVKDSQVMELEWTVEEKNIPIEVIGFSPVLDRKYSK
jgi:hypothetical protein